METTQLPLTNAFVQSAEQANKFIAIIQAVQRIEPEHAKGVYLAEVDFFMKAMESNPGLMLTTYESKLGVFVDVLTNGLSFSPHLKYVYLESRNTKVKQNPDVWEARLAFKTSPQGKLYLCQAAGSVDYVTPPELVYEGDLYQVSTVNGVKNITHQRKGNSSKIAAGFCYVVTPNGTMQGHELTIAEDIERLKGYSARQNKTKGANQLYTSNNGQIDKGFFSAKLISHALKWYRAKRIVSAFLDENNADEDMGTAYGLTFPAETPPAPQASFNTGGYVSSPSLAIIGDNPGPEYAQLPPNPPTNVAQPVSVPRGPLYPEFQPPNTQYVDWSQTQYAQPATQQQPAQYDPRTAPPLTHPEPSAPQPPFPTMQPPVGGFVPPTAAPNDLF